MTPMDKTPALVDRAALDRNRARADSDALFLREAVADECHERLLEVNRTFKSPAVVTGFPDFWHGQFPDAQIVADTDVIALAPGAHDLILHAMSLHWANDPVGQLVQCRRALRPDGLLLCTLLGGQTLHELRACLAEAEAAIAGGLSPRIVPMGEIRDLGGLLQRSGFGLPVADGTTIKVSYATAFDLMRDLRRMGEGNAITGRARHFTRKDVLIEASRLYAAHFGDAQGRVEATFEVITLTGWAPADTQPKPLRPGSAETRLADALGTKETPLDRQDD